MSFRLVASFSVKIELILDLNLCLRISNKVPDISFWTKEIRITNGICNFSKLSSLSKYHSSIILLTQLGIWEKHDQQKSKINTSKNLNLFLHRAQNPILSLGTNFSIYCVHWCILIITRFWFFKYFCKHD